MIEKGVKEFNIIDEDPEPPTPKPKRKRFEVTLDVNQAQFDAALYGLGCDAGMTYEMWQIFLRNGAVSIRIKKA